MKVYWFVCLNFYIKVVYISSMITLDKECCFKSSDEITTRHFCFQMSFRPTCCPRDKRHSNHEINRYVYPPPGGATRVHSGRDV